MVLSYATTGTQTIKKKGQTNMKRQPTIPTLLNTNSFYITLGRHYEIDTIEVFPRYAAEWRGEKVLVQISADIYRHSSGLSEWRIYVSRAITEEGEPVNGSAAKKHLGEQIIPLVRAWLQSNDYKIAYRSALINAISRVANNMRGYSDVPSSDLREAVSAHSEVIGPSATTRFLAAADAFDTFKANLCS